MLTPKCGTLGCKKPSIHVYVTEKILGVVRRTVHYCAACENERHARKARRRA
jgi:hypothetical protein